MSLAACAELVRRGDPDRFLSAMTGTQGQRARLFPLYAFNLEIARAPHASAEPMLARMRLRFWADTVDEIAAGQAPRTHEVATALAVVVHAAGLPTPLLHAMIAARIAEAEAEGEAGALRDFLRDATGGLMRLAGQSLGASAGADPALADLGLGQGIANWFLSIPAQARTGRGFRPPRNAELAALAGEGLAALARARAAGTLRDRRLAPALRAAWRAQRVLALVSRGPELALDGGLDGSEFARRGRLALLTLSGRW